jgi:hypothetical protein
MRNVACEFATSGELANSICAHIDGWLIIIACGL